MSERAKRILLDTNIWLDNYIDSRPGSAAARDVLAHARACNIQLLYAVTTIRDVFYLVASNFKRALRDEGIPIGEAEATVARQLGWSCIENMRALACAVGADESDVWLASKYRSLHGDFEDDLILAAAQRASVDALVTNDVRLIQKAPLTAMTPADWLAFATG